MNPSPAFPRLQKKLVHQLTTRFGERLSLPLLQRAVAEAAELAGASGFPLLFLPVLAEEKTQLILAAVEGQPSTSDQRHLRAAA